MRLMSYSSNRKKALDGSLPIEHRLSHLRSCALHMANKYEVDRSLILAKISIEGKYEQLPAAEVIESAVARLDQIKNFGLGS